MYGLRPVQLSEQPKPIDFDEVKQHLKVLHNDEDDYITGLVVTAMQSAELATNRQIITGTWDLVLDRFPACGRPLYLPRAPWEATEWIKYYDAAGDQVTWDAANYVTIDREPAEIWPASGVAWPTPQARPGAVEVRFRCGYGSQPAHVPALLRHAMRLLVGHWFVNREAVVMGSSSELPLAVKHIFEQLRVGDDFTDYEPAVSR